MCYGVFEIIVTVQRDIRPFVGNGVELYEGFDRLPINITIEKGKIYGLMGPNGAGKTTLFRIIAGLTKPNTGRILINDSDENISEKAMKL